MIGNRGYAMYIREWVRDTQYSERLGSYSVPRSAPAGWEYLGQGCYRGAYLSPDGVVYKVQHAAGRFSGQLNIDEYKKWWRIRLLNRLPEGTRLPLMNCFQFEGYDDVNAMDMVGKTLNRYTGPDYQVYADRLRNLSRRLGLWDMHHGNAAVDEKNKLIVPIDLG